MTDSLTDGMTNGCCTHGDRPHPRAARRAGATGFLRGSTSHRRG
ncbi:hypothetical protein ACFPA8_11345 [Streptomyces ovatisporus]|uniref:Uncharacterized protein n=1 Tax=Streptomyces ovatisporus TaxID=1128682 RepID=A0ABV9AAT1_9ACTN